MLPRIRTARKELPGPGCVRRGPVGVRETGGSWLNCHGPRPQYGHIDTTRSCSPGVPVIRLPDSGHDSLGRLDVRTEIVMPGGEVLLVVSLVGQRARWVWAA